jgi:serine protease AprX
MEADDPFAASLLNTIRDKAYIPCPAQPGRLSRMTAVAPSEPRLAAPPAPAAKPGPSGHPGRPKPWQSTVAFLVAASIMVAAGFGVGSALQALQSRHGASAPGGLPAATDAGASRQQAQAEPYTLYITDAIGQVSSLDVEVGGVFVGPDQQPLDLLNPAFDLASLDGPGGAIALATGAIPPDQRDPVIVVFQKASATVDGFRREVPQLEPLVLAGTSALDAGKDGLLMDVNLTGSLKERNGTMAFEPALKAVYTADLASLTDESSWGIPIAPPEVPAEVRQAANDAAARVVQGLAKYGLAPDGGVDTAGAGPQTGLGWMVQFSDVAVARDEMLSAINASGAVFVHALVSLPAAYVLATPEQAELLSHQDGVERIEREEAVTYDDAESRVALRVPQVTTPLTGLSDANGRTVRGTGVGVAVVDSGLDATHADLAYRPLTPGGVVAANYKMVSQGAVPLPDTDTTSGHGTHVASIVAGQGVSDPTQVGVAPGASLYGFGIGESSTTVWASQAFDWILANGATMDPPIRVVTNSWHTTTAYDPDSVITRLVNQMVDKGIVVVFSAGNDGGDGSSATTSGECQIPRAGVLCVAAFDDLGSGTRDGKVAPYSSRGDRTRPATWPDLSAPGTNVRGARPLVGTQTGLAVSPYAELSGTSQAAPHVAGIAALMLQAKPSLTPAQVETLLESTAYKFTDGGAYSTSSPDLGGHYAKGHGLADAYAAVKAALVA